MRGAPILNSPWEPDDFGKLLYRINEIASAPFGAKEQQIALSLINAAEQLLLEAGIGVVKELAFPENLKNSFRQQELEEDLESSIIEIASGELESFQDYFGDELENVPTTDSTRGALWNRVAWALEPLHDAKDERLWYIASARVGLYGRPETLDSIGTYLGITRERARQLESTIHTAIREYVEGEWSQQWLDRATHVWSADCSDFALCFDSAIYFGHESLGDLGALFPKIGELLYKREAVIDPSELELWARVKNWLDLDDHSDLLSDAYRTISRGERRTAMVPGAAALEQVVSLTRQGLRHNGAVDIARIAAEGNVPETALLLALGRDAAVTHVPGTSWVAALGDSQGSLRNRIGKLLSNAGPLDAETVSWCLGKSRPGRESFATQVPAYVVAAILDLTPGVAREKTNSEGMTRWLWTLPRVSLGEVSDAIFLALRTISSPFTRSDAYKACASLTQVSVDVFIAGPFCTTVGRDSHQLIGTLSETTK
jgi:hypothetical protein